MPPIVHDILPVAGILMVLSIALGLVFDAFRPGLSRALGVGLAAGTVASVSMLLPQPLGNGLFLDARAPILIVAPLFGGVPAALAALPLPLVTRALLGGDGLVVGLLSVLAASGLGLAAHGVRHILSRPLDRTAVVATAAASPLLILILHAPHPSLAIAELAAPLLAIFLLFIPVATLALGLTVLAELGRSEASRARRTAARLSRAADNVTREILDRQLEHHFHLNRRFGTRYANLLVSIDGAAGLQRLAGRRWNALHLEFAQLVRSAVRDSDTCAPVDFDRFGVLLPHTGTEGMRKVAERIRARVGDTFTASPFGPLTVSIGMAEAGAITHPEEIAAAAESALFLANALSARNAIGPAAPVEAGGIVRSFPGAPLAAPRHGDGGSTPAGTAVLVPFGHAANRA